MTAQSVADALAWVSRQPADAEYVTPEEATATAAARMLAAEVERLQTNNAELREAFSEASDSADEWLAKHTMAERELADAREAHSREISAWRWAFRDLSAEITKLRDALPEVIGCTVRNLATCPHPYGACCIIRQRMIRAGLIPAPEAPQREEDDGA